MQLKPCHYVVSQVWRNVGLKVTSPALRPRPLTSRRRFDLVLPFPSTARKDLIAFARRRFRTWALRPPRELLAILKGVKSYADVDRVLGDLRRRAILRQHME
jgi:hypothetical protein